ncbi:hypothetical protein D9M70_583000 [compost metagenome]
MNNLAYRIVVPDVVVAGALVDLHLLGFRRNAIERFARRQGNAVVQPSVNEKLWLRHRRYFQVGAEGILDEERDRQERIARFGDRQNRQIWGDKDHAGDWPLCRRVHGDASAERAAEHDDAPFGAVRQPVERRDAVGQQTVLAW